MAATILEANENPTSWRAIIQVTADGDNSLPIPMVRGFLQGGCMATRSGAANYSVNIQFSMDGVNWLGLVTLTQASASANATAGNVSQARFIRLNATTVTSQTITVYINFAR